MKWVALVAALAVAVTARGAVALDDPDWPCQQRRIDALSLGQVWAGPVPDDAVRKLARTQRIKELSQFLEQRRTPLDEAEAERVIRAALEEDVDPLVSGLEYLDKTDLRSPPAPRARTT